MNIIFITSLYPDHTTDSHTCATFALHNFVKNWKNDTVVVIKPEEVSLFSALRNTKMVKTTVDTVEVYHLPMYKRIFKFRILNFMYFRLFKHRLNAICSKPDIVISHSRKSHIFGHCVSNSYGIPHICGLHMTDYHYLIDQKPSSITKKILKILFSDTTIIACRSIVLKRKISDIFLHHLIKKELHVVNSGIEDGKICSKDIFVQKASREGKPRLITVANFLERKNIDKILLDLQSIKDDFNSFTIVGDGKLSEQLNNLSREHGLGDKVQFTGHVSQERVYEYLEQSDIFILPSTDETFGMVYLEALAKGCIVIGLINDGIDGIIIDGENGFLCPSSSVTDVLKTLKRACTMSVGQKMQMLENSYKTVHYYTEKNMATQYHDLIEESIRDHLIGHA